MRGRKLTTFLCICVAMGISACYELVASGAALALAQGAHEFLGTEGYVWGTQSLIWHPLLGAIATMIFVVRLHDREIVQVERADM